MIVKKKQAMLSQSIEHRERLQKKDQNNFIFAHQQEKHNGESINLKMKVEKICKDPLTRQVEQKIVREEKDERSTNIKM